MSRTIHFKMQTPLEKFGFKPFADSETEKTKTASQTQEKYDILSTFFLAPPLPPPRIPII